MTIIEQIKEIDLTIAKLQKQRDELLSMGVFKDKLYEWRLSKTKKNLSSCINYKDQPYLDIFFSKFYKTGNVYYIENSLKNEIDIILEGTDEEIANIPDDTYNAIADAVSLNIGSFVT